MTNFFEYQEKGNGVSENQILLGLNLLYYFGPKSVKLPQENIKIQSPIEVNPLSLGDTIWHM